MSSGPPHPHEVPSTSARYARIDDTPMEIDALELESLVSMSERFSDTSTSDHSSSLYQEAPETPTSSRPPQPSPGAARLSESAPSYTVQRQLEYPSSSSRELEFPPEPYPIFTGLVETQREFGFPPSGSEQYAPQMEHPLYPGQGADAPPSYSKIVTQKAMCIICDKRPAYKNGSRAYPTCGNTCARKLEELRLGGTFENSRWTPQQTSGKGYSRASDQARGGVNEEHGYGQSQWSSSSNSNAKYGSHIKMCEVCKTRPRYYKGGKTYPTCGLTCAAKLNPPTRTPEKCDMCKAKPKQVVDDRVSPYCGPACKNKADAAASSASVCNTCLLCWRANTTERTLFCSEECKRISTSKTCLLEIPRGHSAFRGLNDHLVSKWTDNKTPCPQIKRIYKVNVTERCLASYTAYKTRTEQQLRSRFSLTLKSDKSGANEKKYRFLGLRRTCGFGDTGNVEPCASHKCLLCALVRMEVRGNEFPNGVISTGLIERAVETATDRKRPESLRFILVAHIIHGQEAELLQSEEHILPPGAHSIKLMRYKGTFTMRASSHLEETIVFDENAILPVYLVSVV